jgi:hypothetical protein
MQSVFFVYYVGRKINVIYNFGLWKEKVSEPLLQNIKS